MSSSFYRALEDRFRGKREVIKAQLEVYLPFVLPLRGIYPGAQAVDLGCGRGEWLELMRDEGFVIQGIDLDHGMLQACSERDLPALHKEAVSFLKAVDDETCSIVSGFHIAEHIPFEALQEIVKEALRVLRPGGLLILETPNPENIVVGTTNFYRDPTHRQPLSPDLLAFLPEYHGFARTKILRLQESQELINSSDVSLFAVLSGVSPDYAVVAQKGGSEELFNALNTAFSAEYGLTLEALSNRYQLQVNVKIQQAEAASNQHLMQLQAVHNSKSWRITAPLRRVNATLHRFKPRHILRKVGALLRWFNPRQIKPKIRLILQHAALYIGRRPGLKRLVFALLNRLPRLKTRLKRITSVTRAPTASLRARQIYADLKTATKKNKRAAV